MISKEHDNVRSACRHRLRSSAHKHMLPDLRTGRADLVSPDYCFCLIICPSTHQITLSTLSSKHHTSFESAVGQRLHFQNRNLRHVSDLLLVGRTNKSPTLSTCVLLWSMHEGEQRCSVPFATTAESRLSATTAVTG